jgi:hypothetical protein
VSDQTRNARGNVTTQLGQPAAQVNEGIDGPVLQFRVDAIRPDAPCQADGDTESPENGQFLALDVHATTSARYDPAFDDGEMLASGRSWSVVTADGVRHDVDTGAAWACSPTSRQNLQALTSAVTVSGTLYLDAPEDLDGAVVVLRPPLSDLGWEWAVPARP